jgi:hypothetical protein
MKGTTLPRLGALLLTGFVLSACSSREDEYFDACMSSPDASQLGANAEGICKCMAEKSKTLPEEDHELVMLRMNEGDAAMEAKMTSWSFDQRAEFAQRQMGMIECLAAAGGFGPQ